MKPNIVLLGIICRKINFFISKIKVFSAETELSIYSCEILKILSFIYEKGKCSKRLILIPVFIFFLTVRY
jgi:hypothetical protein